MHAGDDNNNLTVDAIKERIGEPAEKRTPGVSVNERVHRRICSDAVYR
jgi:hypothetical protein